MRKLLISILLILLIVLAYFTIFQGLSIGNFKILSTSKIVELNDNLTMKINETNRKIESDLKTKKNELKENIDVLLENKQGYYNLANVSTESEINKANTEQVYNIEFLWVRVGRHARSEGVNIKMDVKNGEAGDQVTKNISFTVVGKYVGIIDFVSAIEEDSELAFRIEDFHMTPMDDGNLQATFNVKGIRIKLENTTTSVDTNNESTTETTDTEATSDTEETTTDPNNENTNN